MCSVARHSELKRVKILLQFLKRKKNAINCLNSFDFSHLINRVMRRRLLMPHHKLFIIYPIHFRKLKQ